MRIRLWILSLFSLFLLAGCSAISVVSDYDSSVPFGSYRTYRWSADTPAPNGDDLLVRNPLIYKRIRNAVDRELQYKGFVQKEKGAVDFTVTVHAGIRERVMVEQPTISFAWRQGYYRGRHGYYSGVWYDPYGPYPRMTYYEEGTLVIDIYDGRSGEMAWRGIGSGILRYYDSTEAMHRDLDAAVGKVLAKFPPLTR